MATKRWKPRLRRAKGDALTRIAEYYGFTRLRKVKRAWWWLWLRWRDESDSELRSRIADLLWSQW